MILKVQKNQYFSSFEGDFEVSKNIKMNYFNGEGYEQLYPSTISSLVSINMSYGNNLDEILNNIGQKAEIGESKLSPELIGEYFLSVNQIVATFTTDGNIPVYIMYSDIASAPINAVSLSGTVYGGFTGIGMTMLLMNSGYFMCQHKDRNTAEIPAGTIYFRTYYDPGATLSVYGLRFK